MAVHVTFAPLKKAAYLAAQKGCVSIKPRVTFPLKKQGGRIVISTAKGRKVFTDIVIDEAAVRRGHGEAETTTYTYQGYWPDWHCHVLRVDYYEIGQWFLITDAGQQVELWGEPVLAPDGKHIVATCEGLEYSGGQPNLLQILALQNGTVHEVWHLEPKTWEPYQICWVSPNTLLLSKEMWKGKNPGNTYTYAKLTVK